MIRVGLLFDSLSANTGDKAIGIVLEEYCQSRGYKYEVIDPFRCDPSRYSTIIVGGGFLIREPGDDYYDFFRIEGRHVLNAMGIAAKTDLEYLNDYAYVSVRSSYEKSVLEGRVSDVKITPCVTTMMKGFDGKIPMPDISPRTIGIHLVADTLANCPDIIDEIYKLPQDKVFIPFTHYNKDRSVMSTLPSIEKHLLLDELTPKQLFTVIGKMEFVITSSLHASIFAYLQNVPFLTFYQQKTYDYFKDRALEDHVFTSTEDFVVKLEKVILERKVDFGEQIKKDKIAIKEHLGRLTEIIEKDGRSFIFNDGAPVMPSARPEDILLIDQLNHVIESRDVLIKKLYTSLEYTKSEPQEP